MRKVRIRKLGHERFLCTAVAIFTKTKHFEVHIDMAGYIATLTPRESRKNDESWKMRSRRVPNTAFSKSCSDSLWVVRHMLPELAFRVSQLAAHSADKKVLDLIEAT